MTLGRGCTFAILIEFDKNCVLFENWTKRCDLAAYSARALLHKREARQCGIRSRARMFCRLGRADDLPSERIFTSGDKCSLCQNAAR
ncbi:hypothetical protein ACKWRH_22100 [Bradyrhizobium sp. Pa8]|uniref:hypothetical protein n=1 Tax=Bradyrhizobium sp. Pa8 TaxID=3386552 RepID=UPI00403F8809